MRKLLFALLFVFCFAVSAFSADVWSYKVLEVTTPSLTSIHVRYMIQLNEKDYVGGDISINADELIKSADKEALISKQIEAQIPQYAKVYEAVQGLKESKTLIGTSKSANLEAIK